MLTHLQSFKMSRQALLERPCEEEGCYLAGPYVPSFHFRAEAATYENVVVTWMKFQGSDSKVTLTTE